MLSRADRIPLHIRLRRDEERDVDLLVNDLSDWVGVILKFEGILNWENPGLLVAILLLVTSVFMLFHLYSPTVLCTIGCFGLALSTIDYFGPTVSARLSHELLPSEAGRRYREFCRRLVHARYMLTAFVMFIRDLREKHCVIYVLTCIPLLLISGFIGLHVSDLLLLYLLAIVCLLTPGIRHTGVFGIIKYPFIRLCAVAVRHFPVKYISPSHYIPARVQFVLNWIAALYRRLFRRKQS
ncbi:ADP-ribosylation factor protein 6-interacting protein 1 [Fasciola gigantica]|uniref:ADP-ribosylation factor protein 6-interacting protein 1 n=1 Tax=Fasciola gigantica TaxID=46835 RepID=A0A504Z416_FASGI|nr:ADP-ribosylation factor protein 6-interacting protein 1 [Fasciola gigantica]